MSTKSETQVTLVFFSCEGREHLLSQTIESFTKTFDYGFSKRILVLDGNVDYKSIHQLNPDKIVQNCKRLGYIHSIINAIKLIDTEYFFWLEDDWLFSQKINIASLIEHLQQNLDWVQIRLSKTGPLTQEEKKIVLAEEIFESIYGFSANPCICRTELIQEGFKALQENSRDETVGFENYLSQWVRERSLICAVLDPGEAAMVTHSGYLESTPRQWHMTASLDGKTDEYLSAMGHVAPPSFWQKCSMIYKLASAFSVIAIRQFWSRAAYDLAFRIVAVSKS
jgi:hypothetical protein